MEYLGLVFEIIFLVIGDDHKYRLTYPAVINLKQA